MIKLKSLLKEAISGEVYLIKWKGGKSIGYDIVDKTVLSKMLERKSDEKLNDKVIAQSLNGKVGEQLLTKNYPALSRTIEWIMKKKINA